MNGRWVHASDGTTASCVVCGFTHTAPGIVDSCPVCVPIRDASVTEAREFAETLATTLNEVLIAAQAVRYAHARDGGIDEWLDLIPPPPVRVQSGPDIREWYEQAIRLSRKAAA